MKHISKLLTLSLMAATSLSGQTISGQRLLAIATYADDTAANAACTHTAGSCPIGTMYRRSSDGVLRAVASVAGTFVAWGAAIEAVTVPQGGTGIASGTSGGIPYFSTTTTIASSAALTANLPVIGGGAGGAPSVGTRQGNTTAFVTYAGSAPSTNDCAKFDANGNVTTAGAACGTGGTGLTSLASQTGSTQTITRGAGIAGSSSGDDHSFTTDSTEADFLASGALTCGASTQGKMQVHTTALQYCDNSGTPTLRYAAYGSSAGVATSATILATARAIYGNNFDGSAALTQIIASTYGGTGNGFFKVSGPASSERTFTFPNADATVLTTNALVTAAQGGTNNAYFEVTGPTTATKTFTFPNASATVLTTNAAVTVAQGGTGATTVTGLLLGNGTSPVTAANLSGDVSTSSHTATLATKHKTRVHNIFINRPDITYTDGMIQVKEGDAWTITRVSCSTDTGTVSLQLDERAEATPNTTGTDVLTSALSCDNDSASTTSFTNAGIAADAPVAIKLSSHSSEGMVRIHVEYTID